MTEQRVVSLLASATETICALGCRDRLVGRSHECDTPDSVRELPVCTEPKFDVEGRSYAIDERIKAILQEGLSVYRVDADALRRLRPDLIVTQSQCEVCAVSTADVEAAVRDWMDERPDIVDLQPDCLDDLWADMIAIADALELGERGRRLVAELREGMGRIEARAQALDERPSVATVEWIDPLMAGGNWMPELVEMAGGRNLFGEAGDHSPYLDWEELVEHEPDVIVVAPCGFDLERTRRESRDLEERPGWSELAAVRRGRAYLADGLEYFNRPGPRILETLEMTAEMVHPDVFDFGHRGVAWEPI